MRASSPMPCSVEGCDRDRQARGWCPAHYNRWLRTGDVQAHVPMDGSRSRKCSVEDCERRHYADGYCQMHSLRNARNGSPDRVNGYAKGALCSASGCDSIVKAKGFCPFHYQRMQKGIPMDLPRQAYDGNAKSYNASHHRTSQRRGVAKLHNCLECGKGACYWAYNGQDPDELYDAGLNAYFSADPDFYDPLCGKCHAARDAALRSSELREYRQWKYRTGLTLADCQCGD